MFKSLLENLKMVISLSVAAVFSIVIVWLLFSFYSTTATLAALLGALSGWAAGILLSPYEKKNKSDSGRFPKLSSDWSPDLD